MRYHKLTVVLAGLLVFAASNPAHAAVVWNEQGDAGAFLGTANITTGAGALDKIIGTLPDNVLPDGTPNIVDPFAVDMYAIYIPVMSQFEASTDNFPDTDLLDTWLYLFDENGLGVAASASSDDGSLLGSFNATISQGSVTGDPGRYYLAVTRLDSIARGSSGDIFPTLAGSSNGTVVYPGAPGGSDPLSDWNWFPDLLDFDNYTIDLQGAQVAAPGGVIPEPGAMLIWLMLGGFVAFGASRKAKRAVR